LQKLTHVDLPRQFRWNRTLPCTNILAVIRNGIL